MGWGIGIYDLARILVKKPCKGYYLRWYYNGYHYWFFLPGTLSVRTEGEKYRTIGTRDVKMGSGQITLGQCRGIRTIMNTREVSLYTVDGWMNIRIEPGTLVVYGNQVDGYEIEITAVLGSKYISYTTGYSPTVFIPDVPPIPYVPPPVIPPTILCDLDDNIYTTIIVGTQEWTIENFKCTKYSDGSSIINIILDAAWSADVTGAYCWYNNSITYKVPYGALYNWYAVTNVKGLVYLERGGIQELGWRIPTDTDINTLITFLGGSTVAGGKLKEVGVTHWDTPNTGASNSSGFTGLPGGYRFVGGFYNIGSSSMHMSSVPFGSRTYGLTLGYNSSGAVLDDYHILVGCSVRLVRDLP
jgi:uncharacterized protein (TIGR02145 family)